MYKRSETALRNLATRYPHDAAGIDRTSLELSRSGVVDLDTDKRAAMASNLMVSLTSEHAVTPVINTGTLYQG